MLYTVSYTGFAKQLIVQKVHDSFILRDYYKFPAISIDKTFNRFIDARTLMAYTYFDSDKNSKEDVMHMLEEKIELYELYLVSNKMQCNI